MTIAAFFPSIIDSTQIVAFRACEKRWSYEFLSHLASPQPSVDLHFGGAFARGMEVARKEFFINGRSQDEALCAALNAALEFYGKNFDLQRTPVSLEKKPKNAGTLLLALDGYFKTWPLGSCGLRPYGGDQGIEFSFAIPIPEALHPDNGDPILYGGRFDLLGEWEGLPTVTDEKTASSFSESWADQFSLRNQFLGYLYAARKFGIPTSQVLVRGIAIQVREIKYLQAVKFFPDYMLERWYEELVETLHRMIAAYQRRRFAYNLGDSCNSYGGCTFMQLCTSRVPEEWFDNFARRYWNPLDKNPEKEAA